MGTMPATKADSTAPQNRSGTETSSSVAKSDGENPVPASKALVSFCILLDYRYKHANLQQKHASNLLTIFKIQE